MSDATRPIEERIDEVLGSPDDPMPELERRAQALLPGERAIVWEGDASTFEFSFVSGSAEEILGYPADRWTSEPTFWSGVVVHPEDRDEAVAFCALSTAKAAGHDFEYRAVAADGRVVRLRDVVRVILNDRGIPERLRGVMVEIADHGSQEDPDA
jgi:PAS domain-containing protein